MATVGWVDTEKLDDVWPDAPEEAEQLDPVLAASFELCVDYLPTVAVLQWELDRAIDPEVEPPERWRLAQVMWAQHLWARKMAGNNATFGGSDMSMATWPLVLEAKGLLRPRKMGGIF